MITLERAALEEGQDVDFVELSGWLFDDNSDERDVKSIINDFTETLKSDFGVKKIINAQNVEIDHKAAKSENVTMDVFVARFLKFYPEYKDEYKNNVAQHGEFLYEMFFSSTGVKAVQGTLKDGTNKQKEKMMIMFEECYINGDEAVCSSIIYSIFAVVLVKKDFFRTEYVFEYMEKTPFLKEAVNAMLTFMKSERNRKKYL